MLLDARVDDAGELLRRHRLGDLKVEELVGVGPVDVAEVLRDRAVEYEPSERRVDDLRLHLAVALLEDAYLDRRVYAEQMVLIRHHRLVKVAEGVTLAGLAGLIHREIEVAYDHVLRRDRDRLAVRRL